MMKQKKQIKSHKTFLQSWLIIYLLIAYAVYLFFRDHPLAETLFDGLQIIASLGAGILIMRKGLAKSPFNYIVYTGYACLLWSLGQLFWFAYVVVGREGLPYPSVAEMAFWGAYFFLMTAIKIKSDAHQQNRFYMSALVSAAMVVITIAAVLYTGTLNTFESVYTILFMSVAAWTLFMALNLSGLPLWLRGSVSLLCFADLLLVLQLMLGTDPTLFLSDPLFPLPFVLLLFGVMNNRSENSSVIREGS